MMITLWAFILLADYTDHRTPFQVGPFTSQVSCEEIRTLIHEDFNVPIRRVLISRCFKVMR